MQLYGTDNYDMSDLPLPAEDALLDWWQIGHGNLEFNIFYHFEAGVVFCGPDWGNYDADEGEWTPSFIDWVKRYQFGKEITD